MKLNLIPCHHTKLNDILNLSRLIPNIKLYNTSTTLKSAETQLCSKPTELPRFSLINTVLPYLYGSCSLRTRIVSTKILTAIEILSMK